MRIEYFPETDTLYIDLAERAGVDTGEVAERGCGLASRHSRQPHW